MIGLLYSQSESTRIAVTPNSVRQNPAKLDNDVVWYSDNPPHSQREVASWAGLMGDVFGLESNMDAAKAKRLVKRIDSAIPPEFQVKGKNLRSAMYDWVPALFKLIDPFPESIGNKFLDSVSVSLPGEGYSKRINALGGAKLSDFLLPDSLARTKIMPSGSTGKKMGIYLVKVHGLTGVLESLNGKSKWVTSHQLIRLRSHGELQISEGVIVLGDQPMVPLNKHPIAERFMMIRESVPEASQGHYDDLVLRFLMNIPRSGGIHPFSLLLRGQSWLKASLQAQKQLDNGIKIIGFDSQAITAEQPDYD